MKTPRTPYTVTIRMGALHNELTAGTFKEPLHHPEPKTKWNHKERSAKHQALGQLAAILSEALGLPGEASLEATPKPTAKKRWHHPHRNRKPKSVGGTKSDGQ